jgi:nitroreductase
MEPQARRIDSHHPIHDLHSRRWSPRSFSDRPVEPEKLRSVLEAARWAPSSYNEQPWSYIVATKDNPAEFAKLLSTLVELNQSWAKSAPVLMLSVAAKNLARSGKPNRHAFHDVGAASADLTTQATDLGLHVHQMAGIDPEKARQVFHIPDTHEAVAGIALGYVGDPDALPPQLRDKEVRPSTRKPQSEFVFSGEWGKPLSP